MNAKGRRPVRRSNSPADGRWGRWSAQATVAGTFLGLASLAVALAAALGWFNPSPPPPHLRAEQMLVLEPNESRRPEVQVTVLNTGGTTALIKSASLKILHILASPICASQGEVPLSETYQAVLPRTFSDATANVVTVPLHDEARPGGSDRFAISLSVAPGSSAEKYVTRLYQVALSIVSGSDARRTQIGRFLISLPYRPTANEQYWTHELAAYSQTRLRYQLGPELPRAMKCYRTNTAQLKQALKLGGVRSPGLERVQSELVTPAK
jgi:hypothetical protein